MGGFVGVLISIIAAWLLYGTGHPILFWSSIGIGVLLFWSWGVMHNYATDSSRARQELIQQNMRLEGRSEEEISRLDARIAGRGQGDINAIPNWIATINLLSTLAALCLLVTGIIVRYF